MCSPVTSEFPSLTNHFKLQHLDLRGPIEDITFELARLPSFAPSSLVGIWADAWFAGTVHSLEDISESRWKAVDLALCNAKFPHLKSAEFADSTGEPIQNPHEFFQRVLPKSYECGIIWFSRSPGGMYLIAIILPPSDLCRPTYSHRTSGCPAIPRTTPQMG